MVKNGYIVELQKQKSFKIIFFDSPDSVILQYDKTPHKIQYFISAFPPFLTKDILIEIPTVVKKKHIK